jgi:Ni,Fe-hydrogenase III component G
METSTSLEAARAALAPWTLRAEQPEPNRLDFYLPAERIVPAVQAVLAAGGWRLSAITGIDVPESGEMSDGAIELLYHFCRGGAVATLRISVNYGLPMAPSICGVIPAAVLYEREAVEMFGVILEGSPMRDRLLLPDDWPDYVYPLRKSFKGIE